MVAVRGREQADRGAESDHAAPDMSRHRGGHGGTPASGGHNSGFSHTCDFVGPDPDPHFLVA